MTVGVVLEQKVRAASEEQVPEEMHLEESVVVHLEAAYALGTGIQAAADCTPGFVSFESDKNGGNTYPPGNPPGGKEGKPPGIGGTGPGKPAGGNGGGGIPGMNGGTPGAGTGGFTYV